MLKTNVFSTATLIALLALTVTACDSSGSNDEDNDQRLGSFSLEVSGDTEASLEGFAFFGEGEDPDTGEDVFVIYFSETENAGTQAGRYVFIGRNSGRPGVGTFSIVELDQDDDEIPEEDFVMIASLGDTQANAITYVSESGEVTITRSSSNRLEGTFDINATGIQVTGTEAQEFNVTIEGSFDAIGNDNVFVPFSS